MLCPTLALSLIRVPPTTLVVDKFRIHLESLISKRKSLCSLRFVNIVTHRGREGNFLKKLAMVSEEMADSETSTNRKDSNKKKLVLWCLLLASGVELQS
ncbi:hypothetical protein P8452_47252 [Trifolium repens]|nr:hypothetical protein P8452_47252 [Trifolium repens]